jgi:PTK7 protein tyrosine kinase 7
MEDTGKYGCTARNNGGQERIEVLLQVTGADARMRSSGGSSFGGDEVSAAMDNSDMMKTIVIAVCSAVAYLAIVVGVTVYCSIRLIRAKNLRKYGGGSGHTEAAIQDNGLVITENTELMCKKVPDTITIALPPPPPPSVHQSGGYHPVLNELDARSTSSLGFASSRPSYSSSSQSGGVYEQVSVQRHQLQFISVLGKGIYGDVLLAKVRRGGGSPSDSSPDSLVMVKSLLSRCESHIAECRREIELFGRVNHDHVVRMVGLCCKTEPLYLVTEYSEWGDLKTFLRATSDTQSSASRLPPLTVVQRITMCGQVALGMEHIADRGLTHRDLAARNVLLSPSLHLKVALPGLCRDFYSSEYYELGDGRVIPLRWMAPEVALDSSERCWTSYADVWSFGVFVFEVFSGGQLPLGHRTDVEVLAGMSGAGTGGSFSTSTSSNRLTCPAGCPSDVWSLVEACTADFAHRRPTFSDVVNLIYELTASTGA